MITKEWLSVLNSHHTGDTRLGVRRSVATQALFKAAGVGSLVGERRLEEPDEIPHLPGESKSEKLPGVPKDVKSLQGLCREAEIGPDRNEECDGDPSCEQTVEIPRLAGETDPATLVVKVSKLGRSVG